MVNRIGKFRIGTSNGYIPGNKLSFPVAYRSSSRLHYYSSLLSSIEVNSCFYKTPLRSTYERWFREVPDDFTFTLKLSKEITHSKELKAGPDCMSKFLEAANGIGNKKGCLLIQFPGKINIHHFSKVEEILAALSILDPRKAWRTAIEFRNESWYIRETTELLNEYHAAMVVHDFARGAMPAINGKANFVYMRFHGPTGNYRDSYIDPFLDEKAAIIKEMLISGKDVYAYFNNTMGNAFENASYLQAKLEIQSNPHSLPLSLQRVD